MTASKTFAHRVVRAGDRFRRDSALLSVLESSGVTNAAIRAHPCNFQLPALHLPQRLDRAAIEVLKEVELSPDVLARRGKIFSDFLWQRPLPLESEYRRALFRRMEESQRAEEAEFEQMLRAEKKDIARLIARQVADWRPMRYSPSLAPVYLVARLAPNFAIGCRVLYEIRKRCPAFAPKTLYDFGCGLGTIVWSANSLWPEGSLQEHVMVDTSPAMLSLAERLQRDGRMSAQVPGCFPGVFGRQFLSSNPFPGFDLVVSSCSLLDLGFTASRQIAVETLWRKTDGFLVLIEQGTTAGFKAILEARNFILKNFGPDVEEPERAAHLFAPCPHAMTCPKEQSVCNFYVSYKKFNLTSAREDFAKELFSYVIFSKGPVTEGPTKEAALSRIISYKPRKTKDYVLHDVCTPKGSAERVAFSKKNSKFLFAMMSRAVAGDLVPVELKETNVTNPDVEMTAADSQKETTADSQKETTADNQKETTADNQKETAADNQKETAADNQKETVADNQKEGGSDSRNLS